MTATKRQAKKQPARTQPARKEGKSNVPVLGIVFGVLAVALIVAVMFAGSEPLGGAEFGEPVINGDALPLALDGNPIDVTADPAFGQAAPEVSGQDFDGNTVEIKNNGTPKAVVFVSHSCPHCQDEIPQVQAWLNAGGGAGGVEIITVSTSANSAASNWPPSQWLEREQWKPPVIADDSDSSTFFAYGGQVIPYWVFIDGDGNVVRRNSGRMEIAALDAAMQQLGG